MEENAKKKILWISDHPLVPSGVGSQSKYVIEGLLGTGKYRFICFGGAIKHPDYRPQKIAPEKYGDDWIVLPVDGYGDKMALRQMLALERPDAIVMFTDPRFFTWVWEMEDEVRSVCPLLYWHVWDNDPSPDFNRVLYDSTDFISALSLKTFGLLQSLEYPGERFNYIPHTLPGDLFKPLPDQEISDFRKQYLGPHADREFILFWNNRNARRKQTGDVIAGFAKFLQKSRLKGKASLMMHTGPSDPEGQDILAVARKFGIGDDLIVSDQRLSPEDLNRIYNSVDCTINIASNEGFGLGTLESIFSGTPIIVHMTGGLQFQIGNWWEGLTDFSDQDKLMQVAQKQWRSGTGTWCGVPIFSGTRSCTGSQQIPYIYDDKVSHDDVVKALVRMHGMGREKRRAMGLRSRDWALGAFNFSKMISDWDSMLGDQIDKFHVRVPKQIRTVTL